MLEKFCLWGLPPSHLVVTHELTSHFFSQEAGCYQVQPEDLWETNVITPENLPWVQIISTTRSFSDERSLSPFPSLKLTATFYQDLEN